MKAPKPQIQKSKWTTSTRRINRKKTTSRHIILKLLRTSNSLKSSQRKRHANTRTVMRITTDVSQKQCNVEDNEMASLEYRKIMGTENFTPSENIPQKQKWKMPFFRQTKPERQFHQPSSSKLHAQESLLGWRKMISHRNFELYQWFSTVDSSVPWGNIWQCLETFLVSMTWGQSCYWHLIKRARDAAKHPTVYRTTSYSSYPAWSFSCAECEKSWSIQENEEHWN